MPLLNTAVAVAIGESGAALDHSMLARAVDQGVVENDQLDWKSIPYGGDDADEFAKDVAALANLKGGLIVIGVTEDRRTSRAVRIRPFELSDGLERTMRSWLSTRVDPPVAGIEFHAIREHTDDTAGVLVVRVPASPDMPHMIGKERSSGWPYRDGTQTKWMREREVERAYRDRFDRQRSDEEAMAGLIERAADYLDLRKEAWIIGVARPTVPIPSTGDAPTTEEVREMLQLAQERFHLYWADVEERLNYSVIGELQAGRYNPRPGLRRWVLGRVFAEPNDLHDRAYIELHHDGTVLVAGMNLGGLQPLDGKNTISDYGVHSVIVDLVSLVSVLAEKRGLTGSTLVRFDLLRSNDRPFGLITPERIGNGRILGHRQPSWSRDVRTFIPVETTLLPLPDMLWGRRTAYGLAADVLAQFGLMPKDVGWQEPREE